MAAPTTFPGLQTERISLRAWLGVVLLFIFFGLVVAVLINMSPRGDTYEQRRAKAREEKLKTARDDAATDLNSYAWVDKTKGVARIPIEQAMKLTLADLAQKKPAPANPIESPSPAAAPSASVNPQSPATQTGAAAPSPTSSEPQAGPTAKPNSVGGISAEAHGQPAAAANPPGAHPGTQPGAMATPAAAPAPPSGQPATTPSGTPQQNPAGTPIPVAGKSPPP